MYAWLFKNLPGPFWLRLLQSVLLLAVVVLALMTYIFPWANQFSPWTESIVGGAVYFTFFSRKRENAVDGQ